MSVGYSLARLARDSLVADGLPLVDPADWAPPMRFAEFCQEAWHIIDSAPLVWGWHLDEVCDALEDAAHRRHQGEAVSLVIAEPPGATKSRPVSILWQPWVWSWWPESAWITSAWDEPLAYGFSDRSLGLVRSGWYQERWPMSVKGGSSSWTNELGGRRIAAGVRTRITGDHGHFLLIDDPVKEQLTRLGSPSQVADALALAKEFWFGAMGTRAVDHIGCRVIVMQMLHVNDPANFAIHERGYEHVVFPVGFEPDHPYRSDRDRRTEPGEMLCSRITPEKVEAITLDIGPTAAAAQLWQRPEPPGGQLLRAEYMTHRWSTLPAELALAMDSCRPGLRQQWLIAADLTFKSKRQSRSRRGPDWVVLQLWAAYGPKRYLVDQVRGQWGFRESKLQLALFSLRHQVASEIIVEDAANAAAVEDDLTDGGLTEADLVRALELEGAHVPSTWSPAIILEPHGGGTLARTQAVEGTWAAGAVVLPAEPRWVDEVGGFVDEHTRYSGVEGETDDQVAASSLALLH